MMNWIETLVCGFQRVIAWLLQGIVKVVDSLIAGVATAGGWALGLLPDMPAAPELTGSVAHWVSWILPIPLLLTTLAAVIALVAAYNLVQALLRWAKVIA